MNENINLVEILRDCPKGTPLYSSLHGPVKLSSVEGEPYYPIETICPSDGSIPSFTKDGRYWEYPDNEPILFPSKKMRDWSKFFKKGDVLVTIKLHTIYYAIFKEYTDKSCETFTAAFFAQKDSHPKKDEDGCLTTDFSLATEDQKTFFIHEIEEEFGGKLNLATLEIKRLRIKGVFKEKNVLRPFDMVLVRNSEEGVWKCDFFSHYNDNSGGYRYECINNSYMQCIPYEGNGHLLGTTNSPEHE